MSSCQVRDTKLERFLPKNQHTERKFLAWCQKLGIILVIKWVGNWFYQKFCIPPLKTRQLVLPEHVANNRLSRKQMQLTESSWALLTWDIIRRVMGSNRKTLFLSQAAPRSFLWIENWDSTLGWANKYELFRDKNWETKRLRVVINCWRIHSMILLTYVSSPYTFSSVNKKSK